MNDIDRGLDCTVTVNAAVPESLGYVLRERFSRVCLTRSGNVIVVRGLDQAAVRAFLTLLWDTGAEVRGLTIHPSSSSGDPL